MPLADSAALALVPLITIVGAAIYMITLHRRFTQGLGELRSLDNELKSMGRRKGEKADTRRIKQIRLHEGVLAQQGVILRLAITFIGAAIIASGVSATIALTTITGNPQSETITLISFYISIGLLTLGAVLDVIEINLEFIATKRYLLGGF